MKTMRNIRIFVKFFFWLSAILIIAQQNIVRAQTPLLSGDFLKLEGIRHHTPSTLELDHSSLRIVSSGCVRTDSMVRYTVLGSSQQNDSLIGIQLVGSQNFQVVSAPSFPSPVGTLDSISVGFTAQSMQPDTALLLLSYLLNGTIFDTAVKLIGVNPGPAVLSQPYLLAPNQAAHLLSVEAGSNAVLPVSVDHDLPLAQVDSVEVSYAYNDDIVSPDHVTAATGYIANVEQAFGGIVRFRLIRDPSVLASGLNFANANQPLADVSFRTTLSRTASSTIMLDQFIYYLNPAIGSGCAAQAMFAADSARVTLIPHCGDRQLTSLMNQVNNLHILSIYPNPSGSSNQLIQVTFDLQTDTHVTVSVTDANGKEVSKFFDHDLTTGEHSVGLSSTGIPDGVYFIVVVVNGQREIRKVIVQK
jgi:hypothetical protein